MRDMPHIIGILQNFLLRYDLYVIGYILVYLIKRPEYFEKYRREKELAEFLEKLGNKIDEDKTGDNKDGNNNNNICEIIFDEDDDSEEYNEKI